LTPTEPIVAVVVGGAVGSERERTREAARAQSLAPQAIVVASAALGGTTALDASSTGRLWLVRSGVVPASDALQRLVDARDGDDPPPAIVAGLVVDVRGAVVEDLLPRASEARTADVVRLARQRLMPIRNAPLGQVLVTRAALHAHGLPHGNRYGPHAFVEWSARVLASQPGLLTTRSLARVESLTPARYAGALAELPAAARMARSGAWTQGEAARALADLAMRFAGQRARRG